MDKSKANFFLNNLVVMVNGYGFSTGLGAVFNTPLKLELKCKLFEL